MYRGFKKLHCRHCLPSNNESFHVDSDGLTASVLGELTTCASTSGLLKKYIWKKRKGNKQNNLSKCGYKKKNDSQLSK